MLRINLIPKISTAESFKVKSPATIFSPTQGKIANSLVTKSLKTKYLTVKSLKIKKTGCKKSFDKICNKKKLQRKNLTARIPAVKKSTEEKLTVKVSSLKAKFLTAIKAMKKNLIGKVQTILILNEKSLLAQKIKTKCFTAKTFRQWV